MFKALSPDPVDQELLGQLTGEFEEFSLVVNTIFRREPGSSNLSQVLLPNFAITAERINQDLRNRQGDDLDSLSVHGQDSALYTSRSRCATAVKSDTAGMDAESGRAQMVISRPARRQAVFLGQFLGLGAGVAAYAALFHVAILLTFGWATGLWPSGWWIVLPFFTLAPLVQLALRLDAALRPALPGGSPARRDGRLPAPGILTPSTCLALSEW